MYAQAAVAFFHGTSDCFVTHQGLILVLMMCAYFRIFLGTRVLHSKWTKNIGGQMLSHARAASKYFYLALASLGTNFGPHDLSI